MTGRRMSFLFAALAAASPASAEVFEVIHPDVVKGGWEIEALNAVVLDDVAGGDERSVHEFALGYGVTSWWKTTVAVEFAAVDGDFRYEAFEWENVFLLPLGGGHGHDHSHDHDHDHASGFALEALGLYAALEVPEDGGFDKGAVAFGPVAEARLGPAKAIGNLFLEIPFEDGEKEALAWALSVAVPVSDMVALGGEYYGEAENAFASGTEVAHFIGPAAYFDFDLGGGRSLEPRAALLFGTESGQPDATLSINVEFKF